MKKKSRTAATNLSLFLIALPGILYLLINNYAPMLGIFLAFKNYSLMYRAETGDNNVYTFKYCRMSPMDPIGACGHPSELTQQKMAKELVAFIQALEKRTVIE